MPTLPVTVQSVTRAGAGLVAVTLAMADGTERTVLLPESMATTEAVRWSAIALAQLSDPDLVRTASAHLSHHWRYDPRP